MFKIDEPNMYINKEILFNVFSDQHVNIDVDWRHIISFLIINLI